MRQLARPCRDQPLLRASAATACATVPRATWRRVGKARATTAAKRELHRAVVREHVAPVLTIAAAYQGRVKTLAMLKVPSTRLRDDNFLRDCKLVLQFAKESRDELARLGMPAGFCEAVGAALDEFEAALFARGWARVEGVGDKAFIDTAAFFENLLPDEDVRALLASVDDTAHDIGREFGKHAVVNSERGG